MLLFIIKPPSQKDALQEQDGEEERNEESGPVENFLRKPHRKSILHMPQEGTSFGEEAISISIWGSLLWTQCSIHGILLESFPYVIIKHNIKKRNE